MSNIFRPTLVFYHANCLDGIAAAWVAHRKLEDIEVTYIPASYGNEEDLLELVNEHNVFLLDFSFKRESFLRLKEKAHSVVVLDHHKTAHEEIGDLVNIDQTKSGAMLTWEYFFPYEPAPWLIKHVQDRDLWTWRLDYTKEICAYLYSQPLTIKSFERTMDMDILDVVTYGEILTNYLDSEVQKALSNVRMVNVMGVQVPCVNVAANITSSVGNLLAKDYPFALMYSDIKNRRIFSLRSVGDKCDVSLIAKEFGGGGHFNAAGFTMLFDDYRLVKFYQEGLI